MFSWMENEEAEHSLEMQMPFIRKVFEGHDVSIVPILVGNLSKENEQAYGQLLAPYLSDAETLFVISSDFTHWGERFNFTPQVTPDKADTVKKLDKGAIDIIQSQDADKFYNYCAETEITICGRHPIGVLLQALEANDSISTTTKFLKYKQNLITEDNSSVSYAAGITTITQ